MFCDYLFSHFTITKIYAEIYSENIASCHVLEANGFQKEGYLKKHVYKNNNYHDLDVYKRQRLNISSKNAIMWLHKEENENA